MRLHRQLPGVIGKSRQPCGGWTRGGGGGGVYVGRGRGAGRDGGGGGEAHEARSAASAVAAMNGKSEVG